MAPKKTERAGRRPGPRPLPPELARSHKLMATFTPSEIEELREAAGGRSLGGLLHEIAVRYLARRRAARGEVR